MFRDVTLNLHAEVEKMVIWFPPKNSTMIREFISESTIRSGSGVFFKVTLVPRNTLIDKPGALGGSFLRPSDCYCGRENIGLQRLSMTTSMD